MHRMEFTSANSAILEKACGMEMFNREDVLHSAAALLLKAPSGTLGTLMIGLTSPALRTTMPSSLMAINEQREQGRFDDATSEDKAADCCGMRSVRSIAANPRTARRVKV
jgi:hypothetical protein